ncbi:unnamed protein product, partial [Iphiclides podalirius]
MAQVDPTGNPDCLNVDFMRSLVKQYTELGQWTSAFFWADAAAAAGNDSASGDDIWLLASAMLARGELHRAAHAITSRGLHRRHLLCLGVAVRAYMSAREPSTALSLIEECDTPLLEPRAQDQTHNRALASVLVWQARALAALERREAAAEALTTALRADCACYEALDLLLEQHALTPKQEMNLIESLPINSQLSPAEAALVRAAYKDRLFRYTPLTPTNTNDKARDGDADAQAPGPAVQLALTRSLGGAARRARRLAAAGRWAEALKALDLAGPWACADVRTACLVELKRSAELFAFAHALVDAYPQHWTSWFAVGCYYYLINKSEFARRYLSKAKSLEPGAGCIWLAYGHSFASDNEHDQAMAAYFKASQLMAGCHLPPLYVGVECAMLNNFSMCERFLLRAALLHGDAKAGGDGGEGEKGGWALVAKAARDPYVAHEAGAAAYAAGEFEAARTLWLRAVDIARDARGQVGASLSLLAGADKCLSFPPRWRGPVHLSPSSLARTVASLSLASADRRRHDKTRQTDKRDTLSLLFRADRSFSFPLYGTHSHTARVDTCISFLLVQQLQTRWASTLDGLGHACRALGEPRTALRWHELALALRPAHAPSLAARGLCLALLGRARNAADALHAALARSPDDVVALALLDAVVDRLASAHTEEEIPQFPFPTVNLSLPTPSTPAPATDATNTSDMSMSFD